MSSKWGGKKPWSNESRTGEGATHRSSNDQKTGHGGEEGNSHQNPQQISISEKQHKVLDESPAFVKVS